MLFKTFSFRKIFLICSLLILFNSCKNPLWNVRDVEFGDWEPLLALPLIHSTLTMEDLLKNADSGIVQVDQDKFITLVYNEHIKSFVAADVINIDDKLRPEDIFLTGPEIGILTGTGTVTFSRTVTVDFDLEGDAVADDILFKNGNLNFEINSYLQHDISVEMVIPAATKNSQPLTETISFTYQNNTPLSQSKNISLAQFLFDLDFNDLVKENQFDIILNFTVNYKNNPVSTGDLVDVKFNFSQMDIKYFYGYVGNEILDPISDKFAIPLFDNEIGSTSFKVVDPKVELLVKNGFGVPSEFKIGHLTFVDQHQGNIPLQGPGVPSVFAINAPDFSQQGQKTTTTLLLDKNNSNIDQILAATPDEFSFSVTPQVNPNGVKVRNFILDDVGMDVDFNLYLPLFGSAKNFRLQDTLEFSIDNPDNLLSLMLRSNIKNGFPLDLEMQVYLADENYVIIDSLLKNDRIIVASASVNPITNKVDAPTSKMTDVEFSDAMMSKLHNVKYLLVTGAVSTTEQGNKDVKIYSDYALEVKIGAMAKIKGTF